MSMRPPARDWAAREEISVLYIYIMSLYKCSSRDIAKVDDVYISSL